MVDMRLAGEAESNILYLQFPELQDLEQKRLSPEAWDALLAKIEGDLSKLESVLSKWREQAKERWPETVARDKAISIKEIYPGAKRYLIEHGRAATEVEAMPVAQVVLLYSARIFNEQSDDEFKWFFLQASEVGAARSKPNSPNSVRRPRRGIFPPGFPSRFGLRRQGR